MPIERLNENNTYQAVKAGEPDKSITTQGIDLFALPRDSKLFLGATLVIKITGLSKAGVMGIVLAGGSVALHDPLLIEYPEAPFLPLEYA